MTIFAIKTPGSITQGDYQYTYDNGLVAIDVYGKPYIGEPVNKEQHEEILAAELRERALASLGVEDPDRAECDFTEPAAPSSVGAVDETGKGMSLPSPLAGRTSDNLAAYLEMTEAEQRFFAQGFSTPLVDDPFNGRGMG